MNSRDYWAKREAEALKHRVTDEAEYSRQIKQIYDNMLDAIQSEIDGFYGRYAGKEGITIAEAKKRVSALDIAAYERKAKRYVRDKDFSKQANEEMRLYNLTMKVNRLEMLKANIGLETIAGHDELEKFMEGILQGRTKDELTRQAGILGKTVKSNAKKAHAIVNGSFHSGTFSDRIWQYQDLMRTELDRLLQTGLIQGKNPRAIAKDLKKYWYGADPKTGGGAVYCMERLMRTELARVQTEAQKQSFVRNGFEQYEFIVNGGCCPICEGLNGKHFKVSKMMPGENAPPMHPNCRCSTAAWEDSAEYEAWLDHLAKGGTTAEWERSKRQRLVGLAAKISGDGIPEHDEPTFLKTVDYSDKAAVMREIADFESKAVDESIETACVVTKNGEVYHCYGIKDRVFPEFDLKNGIKGATISHNHPISETTYSFSRDDLLTFVDCELEVLRGCDKRYTYEFTRNAAEIDTFVDMDIALLTEEDYQHLMMIQMAQQLGIGYRRWKND